MPPVVEARLQDVFDRERAEAGRVLRRDQAGGHTETIAMYGRIAALQREAIARRGIALACTAGCSYCCRLRVEVRPYEAFLLVHHIRTRMTSEQRGRVLARLDENLARIAGLDPWQQNDARLPCALLDGSLCSAYDSRPAACRKYHSLAVAPCQEGHAHPGAPGTGAREDDQVRLAGNAVALGFAQGREDAGFDATVYELHFALRQALASSRAERRYRDGKRAFV